MTTQEQIAIIVERRYQNYEPLLFRQTGAIHNEIRTSLGDEKFLEFLKAAEIVNPKPVYKAPTELNIQ